MTNELAPMGKTPVASGVENGIKWATLKAPLYNAVNGYAHIPEGHPWHGLDYRAIEDHLGWDNELTYGKENWVGFDTLHYRDVWPDSETDDSEQDGIHWTPELVADKARELARLIASRVK